jgi:hypothetical protein
MRVGFGSWDRKLRKAGCLPEGERLEQLDLVVAHTGDGDFPARVILSTEAIYVVIELSRPFHFRWGGVPGRLPFSKVEWAVLAPGRQPTLAIKEAGTPDGEFLRLWFRGGARKGFLERLEASLPPARWQIDPR